MNHRIYLCLAISMGSALAANVLIEVFWCKVASRYPDIYNEMGRPRFLGLNRMPKLPACMKRIEQQGPDKQLKRLAQSQLALRALAVFAMLLAFLFNMSDLF